MSDVGRPNEHYVRSFGQHATAEFLDGEPVGDIFVLLAREMTYTDEEAGEFENGEWWGYLKTLSAIGEDVGERLRREPVVLREPSPLRRSLPIADLRLLVVMDAPPRYLVVEADSE